MSFGIKAERVILVQERLRLVVLDLVETAHSWELSFPNRNEFHNDIKHLTSLVYTVEEQLKDLGHSILAASLVQVRTMMDNVADGCYKMKYDECASYLLKPTSKGNTFLSEQLTLWTEGLQLVLEELEELFGA